MCEFHPLMLILPANAPDFSALWPIFQAIVNEGTTYVFAAGSSRQVAFAYWFGPGIRTYVLEREGRLLGMAKIIPNQCDRALGEFCLHAARAAGFLAMQFNLVVSTNTPALALWQRLGFVIVGTSPQAFLHPQLGYVDAYLLHRFLDDIALEA